MFEGQTCMIIREFAGKWEQDIFRICLVKVKHS